MTRSIQMTIALIAGIWSVNAHSAKEYEPCKDTPVIEGLLFAAADGIEVTNELCSQAVNSELKPELSSADKLPLISQCVRFKRDIEKVGKQTEYKQNVAKATKCVFDEWIKAKADSEQREAAKMKKVEDAG